MKKLVLASGNLFFYAAETSVTSAYAVVTNSAFTEVLGAYAGKEAERKYKVFLDLCSEEEEAELGLVDFEELCFRRFYPLLGGELITNSEGVLTKLGTYRIHDTFGTNYYPPANACGLRHFYYEAFGLNCLSVGKRISVWIFLLNHYAIVRDDRAFLIEGSGKKVTRYQTEHGFQGPIKFLRTLRENLSV